LFLILEQIISVFFHMMLAIGLSYKTFLMLRYFLSIPSFFRSFYYKRMLNFVKGFFSAIEIIM
jgi:hypothetical protein